jgi:uncharacterized protein
MRPIVIALAILAALNLYAGYSVIARWPLAQQHATLAWALVAAFYLLQLIGPFGDRSFLPRLKQRGADALVFAIDWGSYLAFGVLSTLVAYGLVSNLLGLVWRWLAPPADRAAFDRHTLMALATLTLITIVVGLAQAHAGPFVRKVIVTLEKLPAAFDSFTIVQVSDLHVGPTIRRAYTQNVVDLVNALRPDLIALTGDFVDGTVAELGSHVAPLVQLRARDGVFFVTGNHEYFWDAAAWSAQFARLGATVLANEHVLVNREADSIVLAGVTDYSTHRRTTPEASSPLQAVAGAPPQLTKILLAHQPASFKAAHAAGFDLQLSGHTHSGQYFPFSFLIRYFQRYYKGLNRHGNMWIYVNRGTGYWGPPLRAGVPAEITHITLRSSV